MAGSATGPGVMPTKGMPQQMLASGTPTAGIKPAFPPSKTPGQMFAGGTPNFNEATGQPASGGKGGGAQTPPSMACLLYTSPSPRDGLLSRMPSSA